MWQLSSQLVSADMKLVWNRLRLMVGQGTRIVKPTKLVATTEVFTQEGVEHTLNPDIGKWLQDTCPGLYRYKFDNKLGTCTFVFARNGDALMFKLTW